jgi:hypothetical protein
MAPGVSPTAAEKLATRFDEWRNAPVQFESAEAEKAYRARADRFRAAFEMREPDKVPVRLAIGFWPAVYAGLTPGEVMNDPATIGDAWLAFNSEFQTDAMIPPVFIMSADMLQALDYRLYAWPGHGVPMSAGFQYVEKEWMLPEEYDHLISDPSDYMLHVWIPRTAGAFACLAGMPSAFNYLEISFLSSTMESWGTPEMADGLEKIAAAARHAADYNAVLGPVFGRMMAGGSPGFPLGGISKAPFDILADTFRGTKGIVLDMFRRPDKVIAACERLVPIAVDLALGRSRNPSGPLITFPLHKGADGFMSDAQFKTIYWPSLRAVIMKLIDEGIMPHLFAEGRIDSRLEAIAADLPPGKTVWHFDQTDMARAKATIGQVACIEGNVPLSLIHAGTPQETKDYVRRLLEVAAPGGGFIVNLGAVADGGNPANLHALIETVNEYGVY